MKTEPPNKKWPEHGLFTRLRACLQAGEVTVVWDHIYLLSLQIQKNGGQPCREGLVSVLRQKRQKRGTQVGKEEEESDLGMILMWSQSTVQSPRKASWGRCVSQASSQDGRSGQYQLHFYKPAAHHGTI